MFGFKSKLEKLEEKEVDATDRVDELENQIEGLTEEKRGLLDQVEKLNIKAKNQKADMDAERKREEENLKHQVKIHDEKREIEYLKREQLQDRARDREIEAVKNSYRDKLEKELVARADQLKEMYGQILARLPDINVALTGKVGGKR